MNQLWWATCWWFLHVYESVKIFLLLMKRSLKRVWMEVTRSCLCSLWIHSSRILSSLSFQSNRYQWVLTSCKSLMNQCLILASISFFDTYNPFAAVTKSSFDSFVKKGFMTVWMKFSILEMMNSGSFWFDCT